MPKKTVGTTVTSIPGQTGRKQLLLRVVSSGGEVSFSWRSDLHASTAALVGMTLKESDGIMAFGGDELDIGGPLYLVAATDTDLLWEEKA